MHNTELKVKAQSRRLQKYLFVLLEQFEHALHVNERILDHSAGKKTRNRAER